VDLGALLRDAPLFHVDEGLHPRSLQASDEVLETIAAAVRPSWHTLETGAGLSTVVFALGGADHVCITPAPAEVEKIREYCAARGISLDAVTFHVGRSELVLPRLDLPELDLVLIDGGHGFPTPFLDWFHGAERLRVGGLLVVDDTQLWTGRVLRDFLAEEPGWALRAEFAMRAAVFEKTAPSPRLPEWFAQPFVRRRSHAPGTLRHVLRTLWRTVRRDRTRGLDLTTRDVPGGRRD
jgi:predicted O-methyltransferase YrrM